MSYARKQKWVFFEHTGHFTFWISLSLSPKFGLRPKISQKVKSFFFVWPQRLAERLAETKLRTERSLNPKLINWQNKQSNTDISAITKVMTCSEQWCAVWSQSYWVISLFIARQHTDARYWYSKSVRLSVCLSVRLSVRNVPVSDKNGLTYRHRFFTTR